MGDYDNRTALHLACCEGHVSCVKFLIDVCKVDINIKDRWGNTPLDEAMKTNNIMAINVLRTHINTNKIQIFNEISEDIEESGYESSPIRKYSTESETGSELSDESESDRIKMGGVRGSEIKKDTMLHNFSNMNIEKRELRKNLKYMN